MLVNGQPRFNWLLGWPFFSAKKGSKNALGIEMFTFYSFNCMMWFQFSRALSNGFHAIPAILDSNVCRFKRSIWWITNSALMGGAYYLNSKLNRINDSSRKLSEITLHFIILNIISSKTESLFWINWPWMVHGNRVATGSRICTNSLRGKLLSLFKKEMGPLNLCRDSVVPAVKHSQPRFFGSFVSWQKNSYN